MLSFDKCRKILKDNGGNYTDEEIKKILSSLLALTQIEYEFSKNLINPTVLQFNNNPEN